MRHNVIIHFSPEKTINKEVTRFFDIYVNRNDSGKCLNTFIARSLHYCGFKARKSTVCQKIPHDWKEKAISISLRIRRFLSDSHVEIILSADETFCKFHETNNMVLVPIGSKNVGTALRYNEKDGCTVMVTLDMISNRVLPPFLIFAGKFGKTNMKKYNKVTKATVLFTQSHWMTVHTMKIYFKYLAKHYPSRKIGLIYDSAPTHLSQEIKEWIRQWNLNPSRSCEFYIEFIDPCMTSIIQPPDVFFNRPFKQALRRRYSEYVSYLSSKNLIAAGDNIIVHRDLLKVFVTESFKEANEKFRND